MFKKKQEESPMRQWCFNELKKMQSITRIFKDIPSGIEGLGKLESLIEEKVWYEIWQEDTYVVLEKFAKHIEEVWDALVYEGIHVSEKVLYEYKQKIEILQEEEIMIQNKFYHSWIGWDQLRKELPKVHQKGLEVLEKYAIYPESFPLQVLKLEHAKDGILENMMSNPFSNKQEEARNTINTFQQECEMFEELWGEIELVFSESEVYEKRKGWIEDNSEIVEHPSFTTDEEEMNEILKEKVDYYMKEPVKSLTLTDEDVKYLQLKEKMLFAIRKGDYRETRNCIQVFRHELEKSLFEWK
ncbi:hypothetical protein bcgnr5378_29350 [Bacillus cereus]|nr:hypothetical protein [Bacillus cereus]HDR8329585.1 hypothetical protein [Bacillus cereus]HDR8332914.1 hypothetical protein [Bacillus cereus]